MMTSNNKFNEKPSSPLAGRSSNSENVGPTESRSALTASTITEAQVDYLMKDRSALLKSKVMHMPSEEIYSHSYSSFKKFLRHEGRRLSKQAKKKQWVDGRSRKERQDDKARTLARERAIREKYDSADPFEQGSRINSSLEYIYIHLLGFILSLLSYSGLTPVIVGNVCLYFTSASAIYYGWTWMIAYALFRVFPTSAGPSYLEWLYPREVRTSLKFIRWYHFFADFFLRPFWCVFLVVWTILTWPFFTGYNYVLGRKKESYWSDQINSKMIESVSLKLATFYYGTPRSRALFLASLLSDSTDRSLIDFIKSQLSSVGVVPQGINDDFNDPSYLDLLTSMFKALDSYKSFATLHHTDFGKALIRACSASALVPVLRDMGLEFSADAYEKLVNSVQEFHKLEKPVTGVVKSIYDVVNCFIHGGYKFFLDGDPAHLQFEVSESKFINESTELLSYDENKIVPDVAAGKGNHDIGETEYVRRLNDCIKLGRRVLTREITQKGPNRNIVNSHLLSLTKRYDRVVTSFGVGTSRQEPVVIAMIGKPGIGKEGLLRDIQRLCAHAAGHEFHDELVYDRTAGCDFWNGYNPVIHEITHMNDIGHLRFKADTDGKTVNEFIHLVNSAPYEANQAHLEAKGTRFMSKFITLSSNSASMNAKSYFECPEAFYRRFDACVEVTVKPEYREEGMHTLKSNIPMDPDGNYWQFEVVKYTPGPSLYPPFQCNVTRETILSTDNVFDFRVFMRDFIQERYDKKERDHKYRVRGENAFCMECGRASCACNTEVVPQGSNNARPDHVPYCFPVALWTLWYMANAPFHHFWIMWSCTQIFSWKTWFARVWCDIKVYSAILLHKPVDFIVTAVDDRNKACQKILDNKYRIAFWTSVIAGLAFVVYYYRDKERVSDQGLTWSQPSVQPDVGTPRKSYSLHKNIDGRRIFGVPDNLKGHPNSMLYNKIRQSLGYIQVDQRREVHSLCLNGTKHLTVKHVFEGFADGDIVQMSYRPLTSDDSVGLNEATTLFLKLGTDIRFVPNKDMAIVDLRSIRPMKKCVDLFALKDAMPTDYLENKRLIYALPKDRTSLDVSETVTPRFKNYRGIDCLYSIHDNYNGMCGVPIVAEQRSQPMGAQILGIHVAGETRKRVSVSMPCHRSELEEIIAQFDAPEDVEEGELCLQGSLTSLHDNSWMHNIPDGYVRPLGTVRDEHAPRPRTTVEKSPLYSKVHELGLAVKGFGPPKMKPFEDDDGKWIDQYAVAFDNQFRMGVHRPDVARKCLRMFTDYITSQKLEGTGFSKLSVYESINGIPGHSQIHSINLSTAAGYPFKGKKREMVDEVEMDGMTQHAPKPELVDAITEMHNVYESGKMAHPVFKATLKDETLKTKKSQEGRVRVFAASNIAWNIIFRMYFLPIISFIQMNSLKFGIAVGINCCSEQWEELFSYLTFEGSVTSRTIAGDYKAFDRRQESSFVLAAFDFMIQLALSFGSGYTEHDVKVMRAIALDCTYAITLAKGDCFQSLGSNPSGNPGTVHINSIVNILYFMYCEEKLCGRNYHDHDKIRFTVYGDDNLIVSCDDNLNHTAMAECLQDLGQTYTMADKDAASIPFIDIKDASFLKRTFSRDEETGILMAPLELDSICKSLTWVRKSEALDDVYDQYSSILKDANYQFWHFGRDAHAAYRRKLQRLVSGTPFEHLEFESFDTLTKLFVEGHYPGMLSA